MSKKGNSRQNNKMKNLGVIKSNIQRRCIVNKSLLKYYYIDKKYSTRKLARMFNVHNSTISRTLKRMNIKSKYRLNIDEQIIKKLYDNYSISRIARKLKCSCTVIYRILKKLSIKIRPKEFYSEKEKNGRWLGGKSFKTYSLEWTKELRESIRKRDNYTCQKCSKYGNHVHHIDYNKQNCKEDNLITLCKPCHIATNSNRDYWFAYFTYMKGY
jgi:5-methylcytosine-specific restriction endonuclease McrA